MKTKPKSFKSLQEYREYYAPEDVKKEREQAEKERIRRLAFKDKYNENTK